MLSFVIPSVIYYFFCRVLQNDQLVTEGMTKASVNNPGLFDCYCDLKFYDIDYPWQCVLFVAILTTSFLLYISSILKKLCILVKLSILNTTFLLTSFMPLVCVHGQSCSSRFLAHA